MLDKSRLGVEDKAVRPEGDEVKTGWPRWRCSNIACRSEYPPGHQPPPICPMCGAATEPVPTEAV